MDARQFIENYLAHEYDPVKAKEYYERTKKLKGRRAGKTPPSTGGRPKASSLQPAKKAEVAPVKTKTKGDRVKVLNERLARLSQVLDLLDDKVAAAQARSGVTGVAKKAAASKKDAASTKESSKPKTSSEKKADAKASAERYEKNKKGESSKTAQAVQDEIEEVQKKIAEARDELKAALAKARASSPKPKAVAKGRPVSETKKQGGPSK